MLDIKTLQSTVSAAIAGKGLDVFNADKVISCAITKMPGLQNLAGTVKGSHGESYSSHVLYGTSRDIIIGCGCSCPVGATGTHLCKHCAALVIAYSVHGEYDNSSLGGGGAQGPDHLTGHVNRKATSAGSDSRSRTTRVSRRSETSYAIKTLVDAVNRQQAVDEADEATSGTDASPAHPMDLEVPAHLECTITQVSVYRPMSFSLSCKVVTPKASYVVKSLFDLIEDRRTGAYVEYGKKLGFAHDRRNFDDASNRLMDAIEPMVAAAHAADAIINPYSPRTAGGVKTLPLEPGSLLQVMRALQGELVKIDHERRVEEVRVTDQPPAMEARVTELPNGDFEFDIEPAAMCLGRPDEFYVVADGFAHHCDGDFARAMYPILYNLSDHREAFYVRREDMPSFCAAVLPVLGAHTTLTAPTSVDEFIPPRPHFLMVVDLSEDDLVCAASVTYGEDQMALCATDYRHLGTYRDLRAERRVAGAVRRYFPIPDPYEPREFRCSLRDDQKVYDLLTRGLAELNDLGELLVNESVADLHVKPAPQMQVRASVVGGLLDIKLDMDEAEARELMAYLKAYDEHRKVVRLPDGAYVKLDDKTMGSLEELARGLGIGLRELAGGSASVPMNRTLFADATLKAAEGIGYDRDASVRAIVRQFDTIADADYEPDPTLAEVLRPYQREGFNWLMTLGRFGFGGILADDMGLGKTLQFIAYLLTHADDEPHLPALVVCPASLVYNWASECTRFAPRLKVGLMLGSKAARRALMEDLGAYDLIVTSYDLLKRDEELYEGHEFGVQVLDEAQYIKNHATAAARCCKAVRSRVRFALTGTPIQNSLGELWSIFDFLMPGMLGSPETFRKRYRQPIEQGDAEALERLQRLVGPFILRRLKTDVLRDLPPKTESQVAVQLEGEQLKLYKATAARIALMVSKQMPQEFKQNKIAILAEITKLRQICCDPHLLYPDFAGEAAKLDCAMELVGQAVEGGHKVLLFSQFTSMLDIIAARLDQEGIGYHMLTGSTSKEDRQAMTCAFATDEVPVFLISLMAGGVGLNLTAADIVIHYDPWWNVAAQDQATDRAHRMGQSKPVSVMKLVAGDTIEQKIIALQESKRALADSILASDAAGMASLTREDLLALLED